MADIQHRDAELVGDRSDDDEPLSKSTPERTKYCEDTPAKELSNLEEDEPQLMQVNKKMKKKPDRGDMQDADETKSSKKQKTEARAPKFREPSPLQVKPTQKRGRKVKEDKMTVAHSTPERTTPKKRGRPKKEDTERKAPSCGNSDDESLTQRVRKQPQMKRAVVLLKRMSKSDVIDVITQRLTCNQEKMSTSRAGVKSEAESSDEELTSHKVKKLKEKSKPVRGRATALKCQMPDASSDDEPLVRRVKAAPVKSKCVKRANGEKDTPRQESELSDKLRSDSGDKCLVKKRSDRTTAHRETSSS